MKTFIPKTFNIATLKGISAKTVEDHLKLYAGYVTNTNLILQKIEELSKDPTKNAYELAEVQRRFGFEYDGVRNHEIYPNGIENACQKSPAKLVRKPKSIVSGIKGRIKILAGSATKERLPIL